jgi:hypothetical protein
MKRLTVAYFTAIVAWAAAVWPDDSGTVIAERVQKLTADTEWKAVREIPLQFDAFHPQGMAIVNGEFLVSAVEVIDRFQRKGRAHLFKVGAEGTLIAETILTTGANYHPGGMDFDGRWIWVPAAEYWAGGRSTVYKVDPATMTTTEAFRFGDHLGLVVHDADAGRLVGASWGSRTLYQWHDASLPVAPAERDADAVQVANPSHYVDLQDGQWLRGTTWMLCGGLKNYRGPKGNFALGGLELIDMVTLAAVHQVPVPVWEPGGLPMLQNAFYAETTEAGLRFYFLPGDGKATIYVYEPLLR